MPNPSKTKANLGAAWMSDNDIRAGFALMCERLGIRYRLRAEVDDMALLCLLGRGNLLEGRRGLYYVAQRVYAELLLLLLLLEPAS